MKIIGSHEYIKRTVKEIVPAMRYDKQEDYEVWRERASAKLYELLGLPLEVCDDLFEITAETDCGNCIRTDFTFQSEEEYFIPGAFLAPKGVNKPLPLAICLQGHSTGMHISFGIEKFPGDRELIEGGRDFAIRAVQEGYCAVVLDQRYMGMCGQNEKGIPLCPTKNAALPALLVGRNAIGERVWDVQRLLDVVEKHFSGYVDSGRIVCMGNSGGGTVTFYAACVDERIKLAMPSCSVCEFEDSIIPIHHCCCNYIPGIRRYFEMGDLAGLLASRKLVIVCGVLDPDFPIAGVEKSYERGLEVFRHLGKEDNCRIVKGPAGHQFYPDLAWPVANKLIGCDPHKSDVRRNHLHSFLKQGKEAEYEWLHANILPETLRVLAASIERNYSIWILGNELYTYSQLTPGSNLLKPDKDAEERAKNRLNSEEECQSRALQAQECFLYHDQRHYYDDIKEIIHINGNEDIAPFYSTNYLNRDNKKRKVLRYYLNSQKVDDFCQWIKREQFELSELFCKYNFGNVSVSRYDNDIYVYYEYSGMDYEKDVENMKNDMTVVQWKQAVELYFVHKENGNFYDIFRNIFYSV